MMLQWLKREIVLLLGGFTCVTLGMTYPLVLHLGDALPNDLGDPLLNAWILAWDVEQLQDGLGGLWQTPIFHPYSDTLAYSEHLLGIAVLVAPVHWAFENLVLTYNVAFLLSYVLSGCGMYLLVRSLTGHQWAAGLAGLAFAFCPYRVAQIAHLQVLMGGWMPVALWGLHRYHVGGGRGALAVFAASFLLQGLSNGYYLFFFALPVVIVGIYSLFGAHRSRRRMVWDFGVTALSMLAVLAPIARIYYQVRLEQGFVRSIEEVVSYSADLASYFHVDPALFVWGDLLPRGGPEGQLFAGMTLMLLAVAALLTIASKNLAGCGDKLQEQRAGVSLSTLVLIYSAVAVLAVLLSLGPEPKAWGSQLLPFGPYQLAMWIVPGLDGLRVPARMAMVVYLSLSVLGGVAVAVWFPRFSKRTRTVLGVTVAGLLLVEGYRGPIPLWSLPRERSFDTLIYDRLADSPPGAVLELPLWARHHNLDTNHTLQFQYRTLEHGHPIVNGFSGYRVPLVEFLRHGAVWDERLTGDLLRGLRSIGVRYLIVHEQSLNGDRNLARDIVNAIRAQADQLEDIVTIGPTHLFQIRDVDWPYVPPDKSISRFVPVPLDEVTATASHANPLLDLAFDDNLETRWSTGRPQSGDEWLTLHFDHPRSIAKLRLELTERSWADFPRVLRIESSVDGREFDRILYEDVGLTGMVSSIPQHQGSAVLDLVLPSTRSRAIRLRQLGSSEPWYWSIDELTLWESGE